MRNSISIKQNPRSPRKKTAALKVSRQRQPDHLSPAAWQLTLRQQFGREQAFGWQNLGEHPVFSEFLVSNPDSGRSYRVAIRGTAPGENFCACPDFATNALGSCKHIEFMLARLAKQRGGKAALATGFQPLYSEIFLSYGAQRQIRWRAGTQCPQSLLTAAQRLFDASAAGALPQHRYTELDAFLRRARQLDHELRCYDDALAFIAQVRDAAQRESVLQHAYPRGANSASLRKLLKVPLYPYQAEGALFAARAGRVLIGDEMGLGKTIQAIAAAALLNKHFGAQRVLIVCPTSVKHQWRQEIQRFAGHDARVIDGPRATRAALYRDEVMHKIANYDVLARDLDLIQQWSPDVVIVDEAQRIKNWNTIAARALKQITSPYAIVLTGTPLENRLEELISIVQFVDQHRLGPTWRLLHDHQTRDDTGRVIGYRDLDRIGNTLAPIMIRRRKAQVLTQLPQRIDNTVFVAMTDEQRGYHDDNGLIVSRIVSRWRKTGYLSDADQRRVTCALQNMRMSCNSTYLLDPDSDHGHKIDELLTVLEELFEDPNAKAVVFSQWLRTHELIVRRLQTKDWGHVLFHGGIPSEKRGALVERFRNDANCRLFLSTDAGGVGLNLQHAAAIIINMDMPWNPAVLEQRIGRVHRIGQTRNVQVVNFVAEHTIEHGMLSVLAFKKSLFAGVLDGGQSDIFMNGTRLTRFMESVEQVAGAITPAVEVTPGPASGEVVEHAQPASGTDLSVASAPITNDAWSELINIGRKFFDSLATTPAITTNDTPRNATPFAIETDPHTGQQTLKLPLPSAEVLQRAAQALSNLLAGLNGGR